MNNLFLTPVVKNILFANIAMFIAFGMFFQDFGIEYLMLHEPPVPWFEGGLPYFKLYQIVTHFFMHGGFGHIIFNMLGLVMIGSSVEMVFRERRFLEFYLFCGVFSGVMLALFDPFRGTVVGASGAISGVFAAFAFLYPNSMLGIMFLPIQFKAKDFAIGFALISLVLFLISLKEGSNVGGISHFGHLTGMLGGWLFLNLEGLIKRIRK